MGVGRDEGSGEFLWRGESRAKKKSAGRKGIQLLRKATGVRSDEVISPT